MARSQPHTFLRASVIRGTSNRLPVQVSLRDTGKFLTSNGQWQIAHSYCVALPAKTRGALFPHPPQLDFPAAVITLTALAALLWAKKVPEPLVILAAGAIGLVAGRGK